MTLWLNPPSIKSHRTHQCCIWGAPRAMSQLRICKIYYSTSLYILNMSNVFWSSVQPTGRGVFACGAWNRTGGKGGGVPFGGVKSSIVVLMCGVTPPRALHPRAVEVHTGARERSSDVVIFCGRMWLFIVWRVEEIRICHNSDISWESQACEDVLGMDHEGGTQCRTGLDGTSWKLEVLRVEKNPRIKL